MIMIHRVSCHVSAAINILSVTNTYATPSLSILDIIKCLLCGFIVLQKGISIKITYFVVYWKLFGI